MDALLVGDATQEDEQRHLSPDAALAKEASLQRRLGMRVATAWLA